MILAQTPRALTTAPCRRGYDSLSLSFVQLELVNNSGRDGLEYLQPHPSCSYGCEADFRMKHRDGPIVEILLLPRVGSPSRDIRNTLPFPSRLTLRPTCACSLNRLPLFAQLHFNLVT